jgi:hypothetical protein
MKCSSWPVLASGTGTEYQSAEAKIREKIRLMAKLAVPVMFVYNHEPENDGGKADDYRAAFRRVSAIVRSEQEAINNNTISIGWAPMGCSFEGLNTDGSLSGVTRDCPTYFPEHWYPGDDAVDWVMAQPYNKYGCTNKSDISKCNTFDDLVDDFYNWANAPCPKINIPTGNYNCTTARQKKPLALGEYGIGSNYDEVIVSKRVEFYERHRVVASTKYPRIKMWAYWSSQVSDRPFRYVVDWPVDANRTNLKGFAKLALDPYFVSPKFSTNQNESPSVSISAPSNGAQYTAPASFTISANASDPENAISKVEFYEGATKLGEDTQAPYSFAVSAKGQGTFSYKAKVIDAAGLSGESSAVTVTINPDTGSGSEISILTPTSNQTVTGTITVQAGPSDGIQEVSFRVNGVWQISDSEAPFAWSWDTTKTTNGPVVLSIRSRKVGDPGSVYTEKSINVNVQNTTTQKRCDFNGDSQVALIDLSLLLSNYGKQVASNTNGDCNGDGSVTLLDLSQLLANYGK